MAALRRGGLARLRPSRPSCRRQFQWTVTPHGAARVIDAPSIQSTPARAREYVTLCCTRRGLGAMQRVRLQGMGTCRGGSNRRVGVAAAAPIAARCLPEQRCPQSLRITLQDDCSGGGLQAAARIRRRPKRSTPRGNQWAACGRSARRGPAAIKCGDRGPVADQCARLVHGAQCGRQFALSHPRAHLLKHAAARVVRRGSTREGCAHPPPYRLTSARCMSCYSATQRRGDRTICRDGRQRVQCMDRLACVYPSCTRRASRATQRFHTVTIVEVTSKSCTWQ